jgi:hypothetical protein
MRQDELLQAADANDKKFGPIEQTRALFTNVLLGPFLTDLCQTTLSFPLERR